MRPQRLVMRAFGPYAGEQVVDLERLEEAGLFLIHGATGAGKTSVLDAMCFALFGESSGAERKAEGLRSHLARPELPTEVVLDFSLGPRSFRVRRTPTQALPKQRGDGTTTKRTEATLWERTGLDDPDAEGKVLATKAVEATSELTRLLGFDADQFRQVVVLPQGQFRRLLSAGSQDRQAILQNIFQSGVYRRVEALLKEKAGELEAGLKGLDQARGALLERVGVEDGAGLQAQREALAKELEQAGTERAAASKAAQAAQESLRQGQATAALLDELDQAQAEHLKLAAQAPQQTQRQAQLKLARAAHELEAPAKALEERRAEEGRAAQAAQGSETGKVAAAKALEQAAVALQAQEKAEPQREAARQEVDRLARLAGVVEELARLRKDMTRAQGQAAQAVKARDQAKAELVQAKTALSQGQARQADLRGPAGQAESLGLRAVALAKAVKHRKELDARQKELDQARAVQDEAGKAVAQAEQALASARDKQAALDQAWASGQAGVLARELAPGEACPLCGSTEHPAPAPAGPEVPGDDELEAARQAVAQAEAGLNRARQGQAQAASRAAGLEAAVKGLAASLEDQAQAPVAELERELKEVRGQEVQARQSAEGLAKLEAELAKLEARQRELEPRQEELEQAASQAQSQAAQAEALAQDKEAQVPQELRPAGALATAQERAARQREALEQAQAQARQAHQQAASQEAAAKAQAKAASEAHAQAAERLAAQEKSFAADLERAGFATPEEFAQARPLAERREELEQAIAAFERDLSSAAQRLERARAKAKDQARPDLSALEQSAREAAQAQDQAVERHASLKKDLAQLDGLLADLAKLEGEFAGLEARHRVAGKLSQAANGNNTMRLTFERFVLASLLDEVLEVASQRLGRMSRGRYRLERMRDVGDRRSAGGLDLLVWDAFTGRARPVATLSGGEGFMASLSLALGLADVVAGHAGGRRLDTIFVDEGFGSLDSEALDQALGCLLELQQGGRLVGVISHVAELTERIPARLVVEAGPSGSRARVEA